MSKNLDIINFVVSLITKTVVIPFLSNQSHQPIAQKRHLSYELQNAIIFRKFLSPFCHHKC
jgi:hypothetical protein